MTRIFLHQHGASHRTCPNDLKPVALYHHHRWATRIRRVHEQTLDLSETLLLLACISGFRGAVIEAEVGVVGLNLAL